LDPAIANPGDQCNNPTRKPNNLGHFQPAGGETRRRVFSRFSLEVLP